MKLKPILLELYGNEHYLDRYTKRIIQNKIMDIVIEHKKNTYVTIGTYNIPEEITNKLIKDFKYLNKKTSRSLSKFNFGIKMHTFDMVEVINNGNLNGNITDEIKEKIFDGLYKDKISVFLKDKKTKSMGTTIVTSIVNNKIITTMFVKNDDDRYIESKMKSDVEYFILDSPYDIDQYLNMSSM